MFLCLGFLLLAIFGLGIGCGFLLGVTSFSLASVFLFGFLFFNRHFTAVGCDANPLCFIFCFISLIVLLVRYFTTLTFMGRVLSLLSPFCIFCRFVFLWDRLSVCPFRRGMFILFVSLVRFSFMFIQSMLRT